MKIRNYWQRDTFPPVVSKNNGDSITDQAARYYTDIYELMARMSPAEIESSMAAGQYGVNLDDTFAEWKDRQAVAKRNFMKLSPEVKEQFGDAEAFYNYCADPDNYEVFEDTFMLKSKADSIRTLREKEELKTLRAEKKKKQDKE
nr:MAG: internal scaffolding protein [Microvirus Sku117]